MGSTPPSTRDLYGGCEGWMGSVARGADRYHDTGGEGRQTPDVVSHLGRSRRFQRWPRPTHQPHARNERRHRDPLRQRQPSDEVLLVIAEELDDESCSRVEDQIPADDLAVESAGPEAIP